VVGGGSIWSSVFGSWYFVCDSWQVGLIPIRGFSKILDFAPIKYQVPITKTPSAEIPLVYYTLLFFSVTPW
jgi:hypothetical protein